MIQAVECYVCKKLHKLESDSYYFLKGVIGKGDPEDYVEVVESEDDDFISFCTAQACIVGLFGKEFEIKNGSLVDLLQVEDNRGVLKMQPIHVEEVKKEEAVANLESEM